MIYVTQLRDSFRSPSFILYEQGEFSKPIRILSRSEIILLKGSIEEALHGIFDGPMEVSHG